jgi:hypothetical protein
MSVKEEKPAHLSFPVTQPHQTALSVFLFDKKLVSSHKSEMDSWWTI